MGRRWFCALLLSCVLGTLMGCGKAQTEGEGASKESAKTVESAETAEAAAGSVIDIPTVSQHEVGYPRGCEGTSLYMALLGTGYLDESTDVDTFMDTMPHATEESDYSPETGYAGDPTKSLEDPENVGKRTTINPEPLTKWAESFGAKAVNLQGAGVEELQGVLKEGAPIVVWITNGWKDAEWADWSWGRAVTNNHAVCLVGYDEEEDVYWINDTGGKPVIGLCQVEAEVFENSYNARHYAVAIYPK